MKKRNELQYRFYATLLDSFQSYLDSDQIWQKYWGNSENPPHSPEEFEKLQLQAVIDRINRVPIDSEAADRGTCFNEVVDCIIEGRNSGKVKLTSNTEANAITAEYNGRKFTFRASDCIKAATAYKGSITQYFAEGVISTKYGLVQPYGYLDEVLPDRIVDIKTTSRPQGAFSFRNHWQHRVYPFCLEQQGVWLPHFDYDIYVLGNDNTVQSFSRESYIYKPERDIPELTEICERLIEFIEFNKDKITDIKIFNYEESI